MAFYYYIVIYFLTQAHDNSLSLNIYALISIKFLIYCVDCSYFPFFIIQYFYKIFSSEFLDPSFLNVCIRSISGESLLKLRKVHDHLHNRL